MSASTARQPKGVPAGGQFAPDIRTESPITLTETADGWAGTPVIQTLNQSQRSSVAASLEIDGRPDIAATAGVTGHISEFMHRNGIPDSPKAKQQEELRLALQDAIDTDGVEGTVAALRKDATA